MSPKQSSPLKFSAGGNQSPPPMKQSQNMPSKSQDINNDSMQSSSSSNIKVNTSALSIITHGIQLKRSPFALKNWIACLLTLDGRDKFTKVLQYSSRLLAWWFGVLASSSGAKVAIEHRASTTASLLQNRTDLYKLLSMRFNLLYKSFVESRKAFRMGRTFIEYDKLKSMGWGEYLIGMMRDPVGDGVGRSACSDVDGNGYLKKEKYPTHSIPEHHDEDNSDHGGCPDEKMESWNEDEEDEKKSEQVQKIVARPGRPHLPSRVSSNIGWGPGICSNESTAADDSDETKKSPPQRTVSELGAMYQSSRSSSLGWVKATKEVTTTKAADVPPGWKLVGASLKLIGLMGFWTFDNLAFLTGTGFLDPLSVNADANNDPKKLRLQRKKHASEWGARFYFMGSMAGLYVNSRAILEHSNGALQKARDDLERCLKQSTSAAGTEEQVKNAKQQLKKMETKHFELYVALLKSICDCIVFSNNPGVDLHLKYRGKKNHEGLHCCCGLISAGTVLFGNFPNA